MRTYGKLREKIRNVFGTIRAFADSMGMDRSTISKKLNSAVPWDQAEIEESCRLLGIPIDNIPDYFFTTIDLKSSHFSERRKHNGCTGRA